MSEISSLLLDEPPLTLQKTLAFVFGLNEAILLQQFHYWSRTLDEDQNGFRWVEISNERLALEFGWWSGKTIQRAITNLITAKVLIKTQRRGWSRTNFYRLEYERLEAVGVLMHRDKMSQWIRTKCPDALGQIDLIRSGQNVPMFIRKETSTSQSGDSPKGTLNPSGHQEGFKYLEWKLDREFIDYLKSGLGITVDDFVLHKFRVYAQDNQIEPRLLRTKLLNWLKTENLDERVGQKSSPAKPKQAWQLSESELLAECERLKIGTHGKTRKQLEGLIDAKRQSK